MNQFVTILSFLCMLSQIFSCGQNIRSSDRSQKKDDKKIEFEIDRNQITFRIAYNLVERELRFPPRPNPVRNNLEKYFSQFRDHKAVTLLSENDIGTDDTFSHYLLHQKEFPEFGNAYDDAVIFEEMKASGYPGVDTLYPMIYKQLSEFYKDASVEKFIADMDVYYSGAIKEIKKIAEQYDIIQQMEDYCKMENYRYVISPEPLFMTGGSRGIGPSVMTESGKICYQFISPSAKINLSDVDFSSPVAVYGYDDKSYIRTISVHEIGHSFVALNMEDETTRALINDKGPALFETIEEKLENTGIGNFHVYIVEHIVRLLEIRIAERYIGKEEADQLRKANANFIYLPKMEELIIQKYEANQNNFKNFSEFIPVLLTAID